MEERKRRERGGGEGERKGREKKSRHVVAFEEESRKDKTIRFDSSVVVDD